MITCEDWRQAQADVVADLLDAECARWHAHLGWDYRPACRLLETARHRGHLPGLIARAGPGRPVGWAYFLLHDRTLQIGNLVASEEAAAAALLDAALNAAEARPARRVRTFLYPNLPIIERVLSERQFAVERHVYMRRAVTGPTSERRNVPGRDDGYAFDPWSSKDVESIVRLLHDAYQGMPQARCFAPDGRLDQWSNYVGQLVQTPACGRFEPRFSVVSHDARGELAAIALVTVLGDRTAHLAQMAVGRQHRRRRLGERLVREVCERAGNAGFDRVTLLVAESNGAARRLYEATVFEATAAFVFADKERDA